MNNFSLVTLRIKIPYIIAIRLIVVYGIISFTCLENVYSQTLTYNRSNTGCDGTFGNMACWTISNECPNGVVKPFTTSIFNKATGCQINVVIIGDLTIPGDITFGGNFNSLTVNPNSSSNSVLTFSGNVIIAGEKSINFVTNSSTINVQGTNGIALTNGKTNSLTKLNISGDNNGFIYTTKIDLGNFVDLNINTGGVLISSGDTEYRGTDTDIKIDGGFFRTNSLSIAGNGNKLNVINGGTVVIDGDVKFGGNEAGLDISGVGSLVEIGGNIRLTNRASLNITNGAQVRMCGQNRTPPPGSNVIVDGDCIYILPVEWLYVKSQFNSTERSSTIDWATSKEWENSHFEIERSVNGVANWEKIGEVQGMGWTDEVTEYSFCDDKLPIGGGNIYYRLKQVDFNLKFEYSKTVAVKVPPLQVTKGKWRVYPNPVNDVNFYIARTELEEISSINVKVLSSQDQMRSIKVANEKELTEAVKKGFEKLPKGVFIIEIQWNQKVEYLKVIKN